MDEAEFMAPFDRNHNLSLRTISSVFGGHFLL